MKHYEDYTYYVVPVQVMFVLEMCVGVSASCMPALARLEKEHRDKLNSAGSNLSLHLRGVFRTGRTMSSSTPSKMSNSWSSKTFPFKTVYTNMVESQDFQEVDLMPPAQASVCTGSAEAPLERDGIYVDFTVSQDALDNRRKDECV